MSIEAADTGMWARPFSVFSCPHAAEGPKAAFLGWASVVCHVGIVFGGSTWGLHRGKVFLVGGAFILKGDALAVGKCDFGGVFGVLRNL